MGNKSFGGALKQALMAYAFNIFGIAAGTIIAYNTGLFEKAPWAVAIYPPILSARGVIGGLFCGRLGTALHLGTIQARFFGNTKTFYLLFHAIVVMTLEASLLMGLVAILFRGIYAGMSVYLFLDMLCLVVATMTLALLIITPLTITVSFLSFKHGLDPDIVLYPIESTISDFLITTVYISLLSFLLTENMTVRPTMIMLSLFSFLIAIYLFNKNKHETEFMKTIKESLLTVLIVSFIINVAGATLGKVDEIIRQKDEVYRAYPIYIVYPALIDTIGDVGSVVGSTATTKLALGTLKPSFTSIKQHLPEVTSAWAASTIMFFIYSLLALTIGEVLTPLNLIKFTALLLTANVIAAIFIISIAYSIAIITYKRGLDPDNFDIPLESSSADSITTLSLLAALLLWTSI
ncbi:MAG: magnesium transporter [Nitrososphaerota archaeon]|nr:magnesium transporter [Candidatus Bathyarchaeota archaeon]MDW8194061.1 magnesium transporter [Nitrososphaerota archaeon]